MYRLLLASLALAACLAWAGSSALAQGGDEFQLPPVKLKPDRPTQIKPIPPTPDEREAPPAETPKETPPAEKPKETPPAEVPKVTPPAETPKETPPAEKPVEAPKVTPPPAKPAEAPKVEVPVETPKEIVLPPAAPPKKPTVIVKPPETPKKPPVIELPIEPAEEPPPTTIAKPAKAPAGATKAPSLELPAEPALPPPVTPKPAKAPALSMPPTAKEPNMAQVQKELAEAQVEPQPETDLTGLGEVGLVEETARTRKAYMRSLEALKDFYVSRANHTKIEWIDSELQAFEKVPRIQYLGVAELASPNLRPTQHIEAADQLYKEGLNYKDYPALPPGKKEYLKVAIEKFQAIIEKYPNSDKIAEAAFRLGEIYGGWYFQDWARAVQSYERCWQWDPSSSLPACFNAAKIYDDKLKNRVKAVELNNRVIATSQDDDLKRQAGDRIKALTGK